MRSDNNIRYIKIHDLYICMNSNLITLTWFLLIRTRPFNLHVRAYNKYFRLLPGKFVKIIRVLNIIRVFASNRNNSQNKETICVPYIGHILKKTSEGYKVFNLKEKLVVCQFKNNCTDDDFIRVVNELERIKVLSVSPIVKWVDYENKSFLPYFTIFL